MMIILYILLGIFILLTILGIIGFFFPTKIHVERNIDLNKDPAIVFVEVADFEKFVEWSPWSSKDPDMTQNFEGEKISVGYKYTWKGNRKVGKGSMVITHIEANERVDMDLQFGSFPVVKCGFILKPINGGTNLTWYYDGQLGNNPFSRLMGPMMVKFIGKDFNEGLNNLNKKLNS